MKTLPKVLFTGFVFGLLIVLSGLRAELAVFALVLFGMGLVAWTYEQYNHHRFH